MKALRRYQTTAPLGLGVLSLIGSQCVQDVCNSCRGCTHSPYFQPTDMRKKAPGQEYSIIPLKMIKAFISAYAPNGPTIDVLVFLEDSTGANTYGINVPLSFTETDTDTTIAASVIAATASYCSTNLGFVPDTYDWIMAVPSNVTTQISAAIPPAPASYQTIVSQTGTAAPAVASGFTPMNTYSGAPTFTWARTSAGVYTLTASSAVFNTAKTGSFVGGLNNLNASYKYVVTSSTVITFTFAIGSLLGLGVLGLTATPTDALLTQTMIYVQTY